MGLFIAIVLGFSMCIGITGYTVMHYFSKAMNSHDSIQVDPKPTK